MNSAEKIRSGIIHFVLKREYFFKFIIRFCLALTGFLVIDSSYGYMGVIRSSWIAVVLSIICAFLPLGVTGFIMSVFLALHLYALSLGLSVVFIILWFVFFIISKLCGANGLFYMPFTPVLYRLHIPFVGAVYEALFGQKRNAAYIIGGAVLAFFLRTVRLSEAAFRSVDDQIDAFGILKDNILANLNFYVFLLATGMLFLIVSMVSKAPIKGAWYIAVIMGIAAEFIIMMIGYSATDTTDKLRTLVVSNVITLVAGIIVCLLFSEIKVNRRRRLEMEDDDYVYIVTCIPKLQIEHSKKRVVRITRSKKEIERDLEREARLSDTDTKEQDLTDSGE